MTVAGSSGRLRVLVVAPFGPRHDNHHGGRVTAQMLRHLSERHDVGLVYLRQPGHRPADHDVARRCEVVRQVELEPAWLGRAWRHRLNVVASPLNGNPTSVANVRSRTLVATVRRVAAEWGPDVIQIEHDVLAYIAPALAGHGRARLLVSHDPGLRVAEHLAALTRGRQRLAHRLDVVAWGRYWRATLPALDAVVVFTSADAQIVRSVVPELDVATIPLGIDLPPEPLSAVGTEGGVVFVGGYAHQPNADAALRLMRSIMPRVRVTHPGLPLVLVGDRPTEQMLAAAGHDDEVTGRVERVEPFVDAAAVVALPIRVGGGMRVKLLEALAAGKAVVASPLAAAGLTVSNGDQLVLAGSADQFAAEILSLVTDPARREQLGRRAREWATATLGWEKRMPEYERLYVRLLGGRIPASPAAERARPSPSADPVDQ
jgi:glycosyltransferase involved in cell wall biosynthesis